MGGPDAPVAAPDPRVLGVAAGGAADSRARHRVRARRRIGLGRSAGARRHGGPRRRGPGRHDVEPVGGVAAAACARGLRRPSHDMAGHVSAASTRRRSLRRPEAGHGGGDPRLPAERPVRLDRGADRLRRRARARQLRSRASLATITSFGCGRVRHGTRAAPPSTRRDACRRRSSPRVRRRGRVRRSGVAAPCARHGPVSTGDCARYGSVPLWPQVGRWLRAVAVSSSVRVTARWPRASSRRTPSSRPRNHRGPAPYPSRRGQLRVGSSEHVPGVSRLGRGVVPRISAEARPGTTHALPGAAVTRRTCPRGSSYGAPASAVRLRLETRREHEAATRPTQGRLNCGVGQRVVAAGKPRVRGRRSSWEFRSRPVGGGGPEGVATGREARTRWACPSLHPNEVCRRTAHRRARVSGCRRQNSSRPMSRSRGGAGPARRRPPGYARGAWTRRSGRVGGPPLQEADRRLVCSPRRSLWRGPALADVSFASFARNEVDQPDKERILAASGPDRL